MKRLLGVWLLGAALLTTGCQALYTGIHKDGPNTYTLTRINQGFLKMYGSVLHCEASGSTMRCREIDRK